MGANTKRHQHDIRDGYQYYYQAMRKTIVQFIDLFNDIKIGRYDTQTGELLSFIKVPIKFAPKSKNWYYVEKLGPDGVRIRDKIMPIIGIHLVDIEIDSNRFVNKRYSANTGYHSRSGPRSLMKERFLNPVPYNYTFQVQILGEYMVDIIQIIEQILPYFNPNFNIKIEIPELDIDGVHTESLDLKVIYNGSNSEMETNIAPDEFRHLQWNIDFTVEGYLFQPKYDYPVIKKAYTEFIIGSLAEPENICDIHPVPSGSGSTLTLTGVSAEKFPLDTTTNELSGSVYDDNIKLIYKYEINDNS